LIGKIAQVRDLENAQNEAKHVQEEENHCGNAAMLINAGEQNANWNAQQSLHAIDSLSQQMPDGCQFLVFNHRIEDKNRDLAHGEHGELQKTHRMMIL
jgi:hypothetical protein